MPLIAQVETTTNVDWLAVIINLLGGLAMFLYGTQQMTEALKTAAGGRLRRLLGKMTTNRWKGCATGVGITALTQSSSVTTVLLVGFISAGLMTMPQSISVILGANIGSTITAQIIAFKITEYALALVAVGFAISMLIRHRGIKRMGSVVLGLGLLFLGMQLMSEATSGLRSYEPFVDLMRSMRNPWLAILVGAAFTAIIQSSAATVGMVMVLTEQGFVPMEASVALVLGANVGTCVTAGLAAIGQPREAKQTAAAHILMKLSMALACVAIIGPFSDGVAWLSAGADAARQVANAHTAFNLGGTVILIWFTTPIAWVVKKLLPVREPVMREVTPRFLDDYYLRFPAAALAQTRRELTRVGRMTVAMLKAVPESIFEGSPERLDAVQRMDDDVDKLHGAVVTYLRTLATHDLTQAETTEVGQLLSAAGYIENIGDVIERDMVATGRKRIEEKVKISPATRRHLDQLHERVLQAVAQSVESLNREDESLARQVIARKEEIQSLSGEATDHLGQRLVAEAPRRLASFRVESELVEHLDRVYYFAKRIAKLVVGGETDVEDEMRGSA